MPFLRGGILMVTSLLNEKVSFLKNTVKTDTVRNHTILSIPLYQNGMIYAFLLTEILNFQGSTHLFGVGSFSN